MTSFSIRLPGSTANLGPGYDVFGLALGIYNHLHVSPADDATYAIQTTGDGADQLPTDGENLFFQAAAFTAERIGRPLPGMRVDMRIDVPLARGLGSSSTAIAGGVLAANRLLGDVLDADGILDIATEIEGHPDNVSPCLRGGLTVSAVADGRVLCVRVMPPDSLQAVVAVPDFQLKTSAARKALPASVSHEDAVYNVSRASLLIAGLISGDTSVVPEAMNDRLHQPYRASLVKGFNEVVAAAVEAGALGAALSGAGPTLFAFVEGDTSRVADAMVSTWSTLGVDARALPLEIDRTGAVVE